MKKNENESLKFDSIDNLDFCLFLKLPVLIM